MVEGGGAGTHSAEVPVSKVAIPQLPTLGRAGRSILPPPICRWDRLQHPSCDRRRDVAVKKGGKKDSEKRKSKTKLFFSHYWLHLQIR